MSSSLDTANPHLRDPVVRQRSVLKSVASSSAIEGIREPFATDAEARKVAVSKVTVRATIKKSAAKGKTGIKSVPPAKA